MKNEEIKALLKSLGARRSEIIVYIFLYREKAAVPMRRIVEGTELSEKTVRSAINNLIARGLVRKTGKGRATRYRAVGARALMAAVKEKMEERLQDLFTRLRFRSS